ncbi:helix-turn-helix transcriptional regulator [Ferruginibacter sp. HRS2-29]|uniref:helix-turn-helix transcriptional regulator n=1 Tax=Ferruginibacter sp. HRS2-29 TaxID=2487334 RepID=UPI0020CC885D|nr:helix-turn-helix transcriptional regulator [Ferruginibacter sp. HRS2-29]
MSDRSLLVTIGIFLKATRLQQNKTQAQVAVAAGVNRSTVVQLEQGNGGNLLSLIQVLRTLDQLFIFQQLTVRTEPSPLALAKLAQQQRQRATPKKQPADSPKKSDW